MKKLLFTVLAALWTYTAPAGSLLSSQQVSSAPVWNPTQVPGMVFWLHFADGGTTNNTIASLVDRIGGTIWTQSVAAYRPTGTVYGAYFNGTNQSSGASLTNLTGLAIGTNFTFWIAYRMDESADVSAHYIPFFTKFPSVTYGMYIRSGSAYANFFYSSADHRASDNNFFTTSTTPRTWIWSNGTSYTNGVLWGTTTIPTTYPFTFFSVGSEGPGQSPSAGYFIDMGLWATNISASDAALLHTYGTTQ